MRNRPIVQIWFALGIGCLVLFILATTKGQDATVRVNETTKAMVFPTAADMRTAIGVAEAITGTAQLVAGTGTATVSSTAVQTGSIVGLVGRLSVGTSTTLGILSIGTVGNQFFTVQSHSVATGSAQVIETGDSSIFQWLLIAQ